MDLNERRQLPLFGIGVVQKLTGLSARQIRYYEEHELVKPARTEGKQRLFSFEDVEQLMLIRQLVDEGYNMSGVKKQLSERVRRTVSENQGTLRDLTDQDVYKVLQRELMERRNPNNASIFQGDLSRFFRRK